jgi:hypothetical protein
MAGVVAAAEIESVPLIRVWQGDKPPVPFIL